MTVQAKRLRRKQSESCKEKENKSQGQIRDKKGCKEQSQTGEKEDEKKAAKAKVKPSTKKTVKKKIVKKKIISKRPATQKTPVTAAIRPVSGIISSVKKPDDLEKLRDQIRSKLGTFTKTVSVCIGTGCAAKGSNDVFNAFKEAAHKSDKNINVNTKCVGCHGFCEMGPIVEIKPDNILYLGVEVPDVAEIFRDSVLGKKTVERLLYKDPHTGKIKQKTEEIPFYSAQKRIVLAQNGIIDPANIEDYIAAGGYNALKKALSSMSGDEIISEVEKSGLRGRGGGGFLTGRKWRSCCEATGDMKYIICNGDEGDPGAFMDRSIMEGNPHSIIEGMIIGAFGIGAVRGYIYVRNEYPLAVVHLQRAIDQTKEYGFLGDAILGSAFNFDIRINRGGGAFVCGESSALIASLEGRPGEPRAKYVHMAESGLHNKPTVLNNVESWANVPHIINNGSSHFASIGTKGSKGTKVFSLVGKVENTGLVEVPMGITLSDLINNIGGGIKGGKEFKAVQTGGPSGGCIPKEHLDAVIDFDELTKLGSMMGSGGMIVMDEDTCMVNVAKYFLNFLREESCGKCTPCREGIPQMLHILEKITDGEGENGDIKKLHTLSDLLTETSLCGLGKTAANPVISTLRYFEKEYHAHIKDKKCPAKECRKLLIYTISKDACKGCGICLKNCPVNAITGSNKELHIIDQKLCNRCGTCLDKCPFNAVLTE
ncbi:NADH-ubiquinone oxidoreductase-F iron-sulfur binding region domain-containing protein [Spirochaetota bacterium]